MAVNYTLKETFTGKRTTMIPDPEDKEKTIESTVDVTDVEVEFKSDSPDITHTRHVNVCFDSEGKYDDVATKARCVEVAAGIENKIKVGVIS